jgi:ABC-2 type transport system permease protein
MDRVLTVAKMEVLALVRTKFFILGVMLVPVMIVASVLFQRVAASRVDRDDHAFAVIDHTGVLFAPLAQAADEHNQNVGRGPAQAGSHFLPREAGVEGRSGEAVKLELSRQVKAKALFGFIEIPQAVLDPDAPKDTSIDYYTETPSYNSLPDWIETTLNSEIAKRRFIRASIDPDLAERLTRTTRLSTLGLVDRNPDGTVQPAKKVNQLQTFALPFGLMYMLFLAVMMSAPHMMNAVIEEKMSRISEVLLASTTPFQLLAGKLAGISAVSVALAVVYIAGGVYAAITWGQWDLIHPALIGWFMLFLICAVLIFGSMFLAIGAACADLKDAQSMMQPAMFFLLLPIFASAIVLRAPTSGLSVALSLIPTATPFLMLMRLATSPPPPMWQVWLSVVLTVGTAAGFVWAAGKIFRIGLLMQGKSPNLPELLRWIRA